MDWAEFASSAGDFLELAVANLNQALSSTQKPVAVDGDTASAMAALLLFLRGPNAVGTTALECGSLAPTTYHNIQEVRPMSVLNCICGSRHWCGDSKADMEHARHVSQTPSIGRWLWDPCRMTGCGTHRRRFPLPCAGCVNAGSHPAVPAALGAGR